jgi:hypothetical protein
MTDNLTIPAHLNAKQLILHRTNFNLCSCRCANCTHSASVRVYISKSVTRQVGTDVSILLLV